MATTTISSTTVVFSNSSAAADLSAATSEDLIVAFDISAILAASGGGTKTTLWSLDDGVPGDDNPLVTTNKGFTTYNTDLLYKDAAVETWQLGGDTSAKGARVWIDTDGKIYYDATNASQIQSLAAGESTTDTIKYTIRLSNGTLSVGTITLSIQGTNDGPVIDSAAQSGSITETADSAPAADTNPTDATGTITFDDVDLSDVPTASITASSVSGGSASLSAAQAAALLNNLSLGTVVDNADGSGSVGWTYSVPNSEVDFLAAGETVELTFTVQISDGNSGTDTQDVVITITGTNDAPDITVQSGDAVTATIAETNTTLTASDTVTVRDVDIANTITSTVTSVATSGNTSGAPSNLTLLGMLTVAPTPGLPANPGDINNLTWTFNSGAEAFNYLNPTESLVLTYTIQSSDGSGGSDTQTVQITITGTADALPALFTANADTVNFNTVVAGTFDPASYYDALAGADTVVLPNSATAPANYSAANTFVGGAGNDTITGGDLNDIVDGGADNDSISGGTGGDTLTGGSGNDILVGDVGNDSLVGGIGDDTYRFALADGSDTIQDSGGTTADAISIVTGLPTDTTVLTTLNFERVGNDLIIDANTTHITVTGHYTGSSVESITFTNGGVIFGYTLGTAAYQLGTDSSTPLNPASPGNVQDVIASSSGAEALNGANGNDLLFGNDGVDNINGDQGNDLLVGGGANDILVGGNGLDYLVGGAGQDTMTGDADSDNFVWNSTSEFGDTITDFTPGTDKLTFDVGSTGSQISVGNNDTTVVFDGAAPTNVAGNEVVVLDINDVLTPQTTINSHTNITTGALFVIDVGSQVNVYYDPNPSVAGGATVVAQLTSISDITSTFVSGDFKFI